VPKEICTGVFIGSIREAISVKNLIKVGITHILNVSGLEYTKRTKYFKYLSIDVYDSFDEDIKKFFRMTNRFIKEVSFPTRDMKNPLRQLQKEEKCSSIA